MPVFRVTIDLDSREKLFAVLDALPGMPVQVEQLVYDDFDPTPDTEALPIKRTPVVNGMVEDSQSNDQRWKRLVSGVTAGQLGFLRVVKANPTGLSSRAIARQMTEGTSASQVVGYFNGGLQKNIPNVGFSLDDVVVRKEQGGENVYYPGPVLLANEVPPPPKEEEEDDS